jgi:hypothetical protein
VEDLREHKKRSAAPCCLTPRPVQPSAVLHLSSTLRAGFAGAAAFAAPSLTAAAAALRRRADQDQGMALPAEQRDVAIELHQPRPRCHNQFAELNARKCSSSCRKSYAACRLKDRYLRVHFYAPVSSGSANWNYGGYVIARFWELKCSERDRLISSRADANVCYDHTTIGRNYRAPGLTSIKAESQFPRVPSYIVSLVRRHWGRSISATLNGRSLFDCC